MSVPRPNGAGSTDRITVPCGKCLACLSRVRQEWQFRMLQELKEAKNAFFVTLTYEDHNLPICQENMTPTLSKRDVQLFLKRLRKELTREIYSTLDRTRIGSEIEDKPYPLRYFITGEYGPNTLRPHYHCILFNLPCDLTKGQLQTRNLIAKAWQQGQVDIGTVTPASIGYVTKYCITRHDESRLYVEKPFSLMSRRPGIGFEYLSLHDSWHKSGQRFYSVLPGGQKVNLPRFYRDRIFSQEEKTEHAQSLLSVTDQLANKKEAEILNRGESPGLYELTQKQQFTENLKRRITKTTKL